MLYCNYMHNMYRSYSIPNMFKFVVNFKTSIRYKKTKINQLKPIINCTNCAGILMQEYFLCCLDIEHKMFKAKIILRR